MHQQIQELIQHPPVKKEHGIQYFFDPLDGKYYTASEYLAGVFHDHPDSLWIANMVTHYRHNHISYWNKCWGYNGRRYRDKWFTAYEREKQRVNERAKRQIIRKCHDYMTWHGITSESFERLDHNTKETQAIIDKYLSPVQQQLR